MNFLPYVFKKDLLKSTTTGGAGGLKGSAKSRTLAVAILPVALDLLGVAHIS